MKQCKVYKTRVFCGVLREAGKRDTGRLVGYLRKNWDRMPATMRRYACEKLPEDTVKIQ